MSRRVGLDVKHDGDFSLSDYAACARAAEQCGFDSLWTTENIGYDSIVALTTLAASTSRIELGTAIVNVYTRSAMQLAMAFATLDEASGGRAVAGLSVGHHPWNDLGHGIPLTAPLGRVREYATFIRKALTGEPFTHNGRAFSGVETQLTIRPQRPAIPIYIGGELPGIVKVAAEVADGAILNVIAPGYIAEFAAEHFRTSARAAGRDPDSLELMGIVTCCVSEDREEALRNARATFMERLRGSAAKAKPKMVQTWPTDGREAVVYLTNLIRQGKADQAEAELSDSLVCSMIATGTPAEAWAHVQRYFTAGCTRVAIAPYPRDRAAVEQALQSLAPYATAS